MTQTPPQDTRRLVDALSSLQWQLNTFGVEDDTPSPLGTGLTGNSTPPPSVGDSTEPRPKPPIAGSPGASIASAKSTSLTEDLGQQVQLFQQYLDTRRQRLKLQGFPLSTTGGPLDSIQALDSSDPRAYFAHAFSIVESFLTELDRCDLSFDEHAEREERLGEQLEETADEARRLQTENSRMQRENAWLQRVANGQEKLESELASMREERAVLSRQLRVVQHELGQSSQSQFTLDHRVEEQSTQLGQLKDTLNQRNIEIRRYRDEAVKLKESLESLAATSTDERTSLETQLAETKNTLRDEIDGLTADRQSLESALAKATQEHARSQRRAAEEALKLKGSIEQATQLQQVIVELEHGKTLRTKESQERESQLAAIIESEKQRVERLSSERDALTLKLDSLQHTFEESANLCEELKETGNQLRQQMAEKASESHAREDKLCKSLDEINAKLLHVTDERDVATARIRELGTEISEMQDQLNTTMGEVHDRDAKCHELESTVAELQTDIERQQKESEAAIQAKTDELNACQEESADALLEVQTERDALKDKLAQSDDRRDQLARELENSARCAANLSAQHDELKVEVKSVEQKLSDTTERLEHQLAEAERESHRDIKRLESERDGLRNEIDRMTEAYDLAQEQYASRKDHLNATVRSIGNEARQLCEKSEKIQRDLEAKSEVMAEKLREAEKRSLVLQRENSELLELCRKSVAGEKPQRDKGAA